MQTMFVPHRKLTYGPPQPVTGIDLLFYMQIMPVPHRKHAYGPPRPVIEIALLLLQCRDEYPLL
jgi:hypothetical protein